MTNGIDTQNHGKPARFTRLRKIDLVIDHRFFDNTNRHHLEARDRLQLGKVSECKPSAIHGAVVALIEKWRYRNFVELRERIMKDRLVADVRQENRAAARRTPTPCKPAWQRKIIAEMSVCKTLAG